MDLKLPQMILIKIIPFDSYEATPDILALPIGINGLKLTNDKKSLALSINKKNNISITVDGKSNSLSIQSGSGGSTPIFVSQNYKKNTNLPIINFNKELTKECFSIIHKIMEKAIEEYILGSTSISLVLDVKNIHDQTTKNLKKKGVDYINKDISRTLTIDELEKYFSKSLGLGTRKQGTPPKR